MMTSDEVSSDQEEYDYNSTAKPHTSTTQKLVTNRIDSSTNE